MRYNKNLKIKKIEYVSLVIVILIIMLLTAGCNNKGDSKKDKNQVDNVKTDKVTTNVNDKNAKKKVVGTGSQSFVLDVYDESGNVTVFEVHTDKTTVGAALLDLGIIEGQKDTYGLYVKTVNGITFDYDKDKKYWAFYVNDHYANEGVDSTEIKEDDIYAFKPEK